MYIPTENRLGIQPIDAWSATQNHDLGTLIRARDQVYGEGEFIYLVGVFGTVLGSVVIWDGQQNGNPTYQTALAPATKFLGQPLAVAKANTGAHQFGWYQLGGQAVCATNGTVSANASTYLCGGGELTTTQIDGTQIQDAISITSSGVPATGLAVIEIDRPFAQSSGGGGGGGGEIIPNIRKPAAASTVNLTTSDVNVGIDTRSSAVTANLPNATAWYGNNESIIELTVIDYFGNAGTNAITPSPSAGDSIQYGGITPAINSNFGVLRLRPDTTLPGWYVVGLN